MQGIRRELKGLRQLINLEADTHAASMRKIDMAVKDYDVCFQSQDVFHSHPCQSVCEGVC